MVGLRCAAEMGVLFALSRATIRNLKQNLFWAFAYNAGLPPVAAAAMALSSVFVLGNALRLKVFRPPVTAEAKEEAEAGQLRLASAE